MQFSLDQHRKTGQRLQNYHDACQKIAIIITRTIPKKHPLYQAASTFDGGAGSPLFDLRSLLDGMVCREHPRLTGCNKIYFCRTQPNYSPLERLPGLPENTGKIFNASIKKKPRSLWGRRKQRLTPFELTCLIHCLHHIGNRIAAIGIGLVEVYHPNQEPADKAMTVLAELRTLLSLLLQELETSLEAAK